MNIIYVLVDPRDGKVRYVGKSSRGIDRFGEHLKKPAISYRDRCHRWIRQLLKAGFIPRFIVIGHVDDSSELDEAERECIAFYRSIGSNLTNLTDGGEGTRGVRLSDETRKKMSAAQSTRIVHPMTGKKHSQDTRQKMSESSAFRRLNVKGRTSPTKGCKFNDETRLKMAEAQRRRRERERML